MLSNENHPFHTVKKANLNAVNIQQNSERYKHFQNLTEIKTGIYYRLANNIYSPNRYLLLYNKNKS